jgi:hypothetical protein
MAFAFLGGEIAGGEQAAEPAVSGAVGRIGEHLETVGRDEAGADHELDVAVLGFVIGAHHAGERIAVGDADGDLAKLVGGLDHLPRMRRAAQKREVGGHCQFGVRAHLLSHAKKRTQTTRSRKQSMHEPARRNGLALVQSLAVEPEAVTV